MTACDLSFSLSAAILDDQSACGRGERLALALARENINSVMEARARVEVDIFELQRDSQYETTDTSESDTLTGKLCYFNVPICDPIYENQSLVSKL